MKRNLSRYLSLLLLLLAILPFACSKQGQEPEIRRSNRSDFTVADAKRAFEAIYALRPATRADETFDEERILNPYRIDPLWESGSCFSSEEFSQVWASFSALYDYRVLWYSDDGTPLLAPLFGRLVVLKEPDTDDVASWLYFLIPDVYDGFPKAGSPFSGTALYASLSGVPVSAGRYVDGSLVATASLFDDERTEEENVERLAGLLPETLVARLRRQPATRGVNDNNQIEPVEIIGRAPIKIPQLPDKPEDPETPLKPPAHDNRKILPESDLGTPTNEDSDKEKTYPYIIVNEKIKPVLDSLYKDCMGQLIINAMNKLVRIVYDPYRTGAIVHPVNFTYEFPEYTISVFHEFMIEVGNPIRHISVMEELIHLYQGFGTPAFGTAKLNREVEAKLIWYVYMQRCGSTEDVSRFLGRTDGAKCFDDMRDYALNNDWDNPNFFEAYKKAADALKKTTYKDEKYTFDPSQMDLSKLQKLMADCMNK